MSKKILIIIPYFGSWPDWFDLYLYSCSLNSNIQWHFITNCGVPAVVYKNINFQEISFQDYCKVVSHKLDINFFPNSPYKLCGLKPFYGIIHDNLLDGYDFWGFADIDIVWGDLSKFCTEDILSNYDVFSTHGDRVSGHFALFRNNAKYIKMCLQIPKWREKLESQEFIPLDEQDFSWLVYPGSFSLGKFYSRCLRKIFNWRDAWLVYNWMIPIVNKMFGNNSRRLYFKEQYTTPVVSDDGLTFFHDSDTWYFDNGKIVNANNSQEYIYLHFMIFKKNSFRSSFYWHGEYYKITSLDFKKTILIDKNGFHSNMNLKS